jgi:hypothetical protein
VHNLPLVILILVTTSTGGGSYAKALWQNMHLVLLASWPCRSELQVTRRAAND